jgi:hypothetical protein
VSYIDALSELETFEDRKPWCDLVFDVVEHRVIERRQDTAPVSWIEGRAVADMRGVLIGFGFEVPLTTWHVSGKREPGDPEFYWSRINLVKTGSVTDELVVVYTDWFDLAEMRGPAAARFECGAVSLEDGPPDLLQRKTHCKLFFEAPPDPTAPESEEEGNARYAELFFNIDLIAKRAWLLEKDPEYRLPLLRFLTGEWPTNPSIPLERI